MDKPLVIVKLMGGLGNQLFQYALAWRLCRDGKRNLRMDRRFLLHPTYFRMRRYYCLDVLGIDPLDATDEEYANFRGKMYVERDGCCFTPQILQEDCSLYLDGYWQSESYFADAAAELRCKLAFPQPLSEDSDHLRHAICESNSICLHIRRTDYLTDPALNVCNDEYYRRGVAYVRQRIPDARLFVFSDDIAWCRSNLFFDIPTVFVDECFAGPKAANHLQLMTLCGHFVISNSTFGWWAAWLAGYADKIVVTPATWHSNPALNHTHVVPQSWVRLENQPALIGIS